LDLITKIEADITISKDINFCKNTGLKLGQVNYDGILKIDPEIKNIVKLCISCHIWSVFE
jgi:hypothetical protein